MDFVSEKKRWKRWIAGILLLAVWLVCAGLVVIKGDVYQLVREGMEDIPDEFTPVYLGEQGLRQGFTAKGEHLDSVELFLINMQEDMQGRLVLSIRSEDGACIYEKELPFGEILPGTFFSVKVDVRLKSGGSYWLELKGKDVGELIPMALVASDEDAYRETLHVSGSEMAGSAALRFTYREYAPFDRTMFGIRLCLLTIVFGMAEGWLLSVSFRKKLREKITSAAVGQLLVIGSLISLFLAAALIGGGAEDALWRDKLLCGGLVCIIWLADILFIRKMIKQNGGTHTAVKNVKHWVWENRAAWVMLGISAAIRMGMLDTMQRWDAMEYYYKLGNGCRNFAFTWKSFWYNFRIANHTSLGFSLVMGIGEFLDPRGIKGVLIVNLLLTLAALYCVYRLIKDYLGKCTAGEAAVLTFLVSVTPVFLGTFAYINVDYVMAVFFMFLLYSDCRKQYILLAFWSIMMMQTKEPGMVVALGYFGARVLYHIVMQNDSFSKRLRNVLRDKGIWAGAAAGAAAVVNMLLQGNIVTWG